MAAAGSHRSRASVALSELAAKGLLAELLPLDQQALKQRLIALGYGTVGMRKSIQLLMSEIGVATPLQPPVPSTETPFGPWIIATHSREDVSWMLPLLETWQTLRIIIYDCGMEPLPVAVRSHERVELCDKSGALAPVPFFYGVFDFCARYYDAPLPEYIFFVHGHDTAWHQKLPMSSILPMCERALAASPDLEYINLNDRVLSDWIQP